MAPTSLLRYTASATLHAAIALAAWPALADCLDVDGRYAEQVLASPACSSPVGLCTQGVYQGALRGDFVTVVDSFAQTADTPQTAVALFAAGTTLNAAVGGRRGTLLIRNAGAVRTGGGGEIVDLQTIVGGTGELSGASGSLSAVGNFTFADGGRSKFSGVVCLPHAF